MKATRCAFSVKYENPNYPDELWAADWDWASPKRWSRSWRSQYTIYWHPEVGLDEYAREAILRKFGLLEWKDEIPIQILEKLSPAKLIEIRREKEKQFCLPRIEVLSETMGDHRPAEEFE